MEKNSTPLSSPDAFGIAVLDPDKLTFVQVTISWQNVSPDDLLENMARYPGRHVGLFPLWRHDGSYADAFMDIYEGSHTAHATIGLDDEDNTPDIRPGETFQITGYDAVEDRITIENDATPGQWFVVSENQLAMMLFGVEKD